MSAGGDKKSNSAPNIAIGVFTSAENREIDNDNNQRIVKCKANQTSHNVTKH